MVYIHTAEFITTRGPINSHQTSTPTQQLGSCCIDKISSCLHYSIYVDTRCDRQSAAAAAQFRVQILMSVSIVFINVEHFLHWHSSIYILEFITKSPVCFLISDNPKLWLLTEKVSVLSADTSCKCWRGWTWAGLQRIGAACTLTASAKIPLVQFLITTEFSILSHFIISGKFADLADKLKFPVLILFFTTWLLEELRARCNQGICVKAHWLIMQIFF